MKLSPQAVYCLSEAINKLHEAARLTGGTVTQEIEEIASLAQAVKEWGENVDVVEREGVKE